MTRSVSQRNTACNRNHTIKFTIESLAFQNRPLNGAHSISDIKLFCLNITVFPNFAKFWLEDKNDSGQLKICSNEKTLYFKIFVRFNFSMTKLFKFLVASLIFSAWGGDKGWATCRFSFTIRHNGAHRRWRVGGIANDVFKMRKVIEFQSSWIVIYYKIHFCVLLQPIHACEVPVVIVISKYIIYSLALKETQW